MPICATAQAFIHPPSRTAVISPPSHDQRNLTLQFGIIQKKNPSVREEVSSTIAVRNAQQSMNQMRPSETHCVSHVAPSVAIMTSFTTLRIGIDITTVAITGMAIIIIGYM